ncbi:MAG TPA: hypothetical protein VF590_07280 [Isosphaeraceae bacterium]|jgi:hypothetical protein
METAGSGSPEVRSPLEGFLRDYAEVVGGMWDEVEPQVYDLMLPAEGEIVRIAFDPEAIPEHPGAQLASYGTPLVNRLLDDAVARGRHAELFLVGLNLSPQGLDGRLRRALTLSGGLELRIGRLRPLHFPQAVFWFEATFVSDQREQDLVSVALDLHYARQARHLERLLDRSHFAEEPWTPLAEARHVPLTAAYPKARDRVVRTVAALANTRGRELAERLDRQVERMLRYYADLRAEVDEQARKAGGRGEDPAKFAARREALEREEHLRIAELRQKSTLAVQLRLINLLVIHQPKLLLTATIAGTGGPPEALELVWDPLLDGLEAVPCPSCGQPTFAVELNRQKRLACPSCAATPPAPTRPPRR